MASTVQDDCSSSVTSSPLKSFSMMALSSPSPSPYSPCPKSDELGLRLVHLLLNCANLVVTGNFSHANAFLEQISLLAAPDGDAMQRIASHFAEALARRILRSWPGIHRALDATRATITVVAEAAMARRHFLDLCPFLCLSFIVTNQAIMEAMEGEKVVHIVDLNASEPSQWISLLQGFSNRPEGPPHLKITGVHEQKELLNHMAKRLKEEAEQLKIPFQFNAVVGRLDCLNVEKLNVKSGEALAISSVLQLHCLLASDDDGGSHRKMLIPTTKNSSVAQIHRIVPISQQKFGEFLEKDQVVDAYSSSSDSALFSLSLVAQTAPMESFLASLRSLSPKIMVVTEQESSHNGQTLNERFMESLFYYAALFDCLDSTLPRHSIERLRMEKMLFGEEIKNIIACEGWERKERHEKLERWAQRLDVAGFARVPLSYVGMLQARTMLLQRFRCEGYKVNEVNGCFTICWQDRPMFSVSSWRCKRHEV